MLFYIINVNLILEVFFLVFDLSHSSMPMTEPLIPMASRGVILQTKEKMARVGTRQQKTQNQQICQKPGLVVLTLELLVWVAGSLTVTVV